MDTLMLTRAAGVSQFSLCHCQTSINTPLAPLSIKSGIFFQLSTEYFLSKDWRSHLKKKKKRGHQTAESFCRASNFKDLQSYIHQLLFMWTQVKDSNLCLSFFYVKLETLGVFPSLFHFPVVKNILCNTRDMSSIPDQGTKIPNATEQLSPHATTRESVRCIKRSHIMQ